MQSMYDDEITSIKIIDDDYTITPSDLQNSSSKKGLPAHVVSRILRERRTASAEPSSSVEKHTYFISRKTQSPSNFQLDDVLKTHYLDSDSSFERSQKRQLEDKAQIADTEDKWSRLKARMSAVKMVQELQTQVTESLHQLESTSIDATIETAESMDMLSEIMKKTGKLDFDSLVNQNRANMEDIFTNHENITKNRKIVLKDLQQWFKDSFNKSATDDGGMSFGDNDSVDSEFFMTSVKENSEKWHQLLDASKENIEDMLSSMKKKSKKLVDMQATIRDVVDYVEKASLQTPHNTLKAKNNDLEKIILNLKMELHDATKKLTATENKLRFYDELNDRNNKKEGKKNLGIQREVDTLKQRIESMEADAGRKQAEHLHELSKLKAEIEKREFALRVETHDKINHKKYSDLLRKDVQDRNKEVEAKIDRINELHADIIARDGAISDLNKQIKQFYQKQKSILQSLQDRDGNTILSGGVPVGENKSTLQQLVGALQNQVQELEEKRNMKTHSMIAASTQTDEEYLAAKDKDRRDGVLTLQMKEYDDQNDYLFVQAVREKEEVKRELRNKELELEQIKTNNQSQWSYMEKQLQSQKNKNAEIKNQLKSIMNELKNMTIVPKKSSKELKESVNKDNQDASPTPVAMETAPPITTKQSKHTQQDIIKQIKSIVEDTSESDITEYSLTPNPSTTSTNTATNSNVVIAQPIISSAPQLSQASIDMSMLLPSTQTSAIKSDTKPPESQTNHRLNNSVSSFGAVLNQKVSVTQSDGFVELDTNTKPTIAPNHPHNNNNNAPVHDHMNDSQNNSNQQPNTNATTTPEMLINMEVIDNESNQKIEKMASQSKLVIEDTVPLVDYIRPNMDVADVSRLMASFISKSRVEQEKNNRQFMKYKAIVSALKKKLTDEQQKNEENEKVIPEDADFRKLIKDYHSIKRALGFIHNQTENYHKDLVTLYPIDFCSEQNVMGMDDWKDDPSESNSMVSETIKQFRILYFTLKNFIEYIFDAGAKEPHEQHVRLKYQQMKQDLERLRDEMANVQSNNSLPVTSPPVTNHHHTDHTNNTLQSTTLPPPAYTVTPSPQQSKWKSTKSNPPPVVDHVKKSDNGVATSSILNEFSNTAEMTLLKDKSSELLSKNKEISELRVSCLFHKFYEKLKLRQFQAELHSIRNSSSGFRQLNIDVYVGLIEEQKKLILRWEKKIKQFTINKKNNAEDALRVLTQVVSESSKESKRKIRFSDESVAVEQSGVGRPDSRASNDSNKSPKNLKLPYLMKADKGQQRLSSAPHNL
ncbi:caspase recruitment domain-containing protein [Acrasis kona]|uniref:Caspase recruitment domain-containing protein n=1 Tax=Acrasis kona TaxID=1008807 RepID=A0AAW2Z262_9EUKA